MEDAPSLAMKGFGIASFAMGKTAFPFSAMSRISLQGWSQV
jgi:hypothetical protein